MQPDNTLCNDIIYYSVFSPPNLPPGECEVPCKFFVNLIINRACTGYQAYLYTEHKHMVVGHMQVKGTVPRDIFLLRFYIRQIFPSPDRHFLLNMDGFNLIFKVDRNIIGKDIFQSIDHMP
jgi:hypothetical protein